MKHLQPFSNRARILLRRTSLRSSTGHLRTSIYAAPSQTQKTTSFNRPFSSTVYIFKGLQPDTSDPAPPNTEPTGPSPASLQPASLDDAQYHEIADQYLEDLQRILEEKAEDASLGLEIEYSQGVMNLNTPQGIYVVNKQPPNKQIWLSSPVSGPKRYDWVVSGHGQNTKADTEIEVGDDGHPGGGKWMYLRDGSCLSDLLKDEIKIEVGAQQHLQQQQQQLPDEIA